MDFEFCVCSYVVALCIAVCHSFIRSFIGSLVKCSSRSGASTNCTSVTHITSLNVSLSDYVHVLCSY